MVTSVGIVFRSKAEQKVADAGYDPARLPPGQYLTEKWPVLHAGTVPETDLAGWDFKVFGEQEGIPNPEFGEASSELLDADVEPTLSAEELEQLRIEAGMPAWGKEIDDTILPAEAGLDETHISFTKGCYPGQEPIARLRNRGKVNRRLRVLEVEGARPGDEIRVGDKVVGRVTSAGGNRALGYVRVEVPKEAELEVGIDRKTGRTRTA